MFDSTVLIHIWKPFSSRQIATSMEHFVFLWSKVFQWLREWGREKKTCSEYSYTACVSSPKMESPNGAAKLSRGKQSSSLQGENTSTEIDTQAHGITHSQRHWHNMHKYTVWIQIPADWEGNVHKKWVKHWKCNVAWHHLNSPRFLIHFNRTDSLKGLSLVTSGGQDV